MREPVEPAPGDARCMRRRGDRGVETRDDRPDARAQGVSVILWPAGISFEKSVVPPNSVDTV
jgi:hypothetical protein